MTINRVLILAVILGGAMLFVYFSSPRHNSRQPRVYMAKIPNQPDAEAAQATKYLREACSDIVLVKDQRRADYRLTALWAGTPAEGSLGGWVVIVSRNDLPLVFHREGSPDAIETFRQTCTAIRDDAKELVDFDASTQSMPVDRYSLNSANPVGLFLLDMKTGAVWQLEPVGNTQEFTRISVEGLYNNRVLGEGH
jgi:hypothetical protein